MGLVEAENQLLLLLHRFEGTKNLLSVEPVLCQVLVNKSTGEKYLQLETSGCLSSATLQIYRRLFVTLILNAGRVKCSPSSRVDQLFSFFLTFL